MKNKALLQANLKLRVLVGFIILAIILIAFSFMGCETSAEDIKSEGNSQSNSSITNNPPAASGPTLFFPTINDLLDNGCLDKSDPIDWKFSWQSVQDAEAYHLYVKGYNAIYPVIDKDFITQNEFHYNCDACYITDYNAKQWTWKVRVKVKGNWSEWSSSSFDVENINTDCSNKY
jgi:hypothetical protein